MHIQAQFVTKSGAQCDFWTAAEDMVAFLDIPGNDLAVKQQTTEIVQSTLQSGISDIVDITQSLHEELSLYKKRMQNATYFVKALLIREVADGFEIVRAGAQNPLTIVNNTLEEVQLKGMALAFPVADIRANTTSAKVHSDVQIVSYSDSLQYVQLEGQDLKKTGIIELVKKSMGKDMLQVLTEHFQHCEVPRGESSAVMIVSK